MTLVDYSVVTWYTLMIRSHRQDRTAVGCIRNGVVLGLGGLATGLPLFLIIGGLKALSVPTGRDNTGTVQSWTS